MNNKEFSDQFDVLYNNITSNQAPGLNEYEKSIFLTKAQDELLKNYFLPQSNTKQAGFDGNQKRQIDYSMLMDCAIYSAAAGDAKAGRLQGQMDPRAYHFRIDKELLYIINESIEFFKNENVSLGIRQVIPLTFEEYTRLMSKPFKEPVKYQAWRLFTNTGNAQTGMELYPEVDIILTSADKKKYMSGSSLNDGLKYIIRYVKKPQPIILADFSETFGESITIDGRKGNEPEYANTANGGVGRDKWYPCELQPAIHEEILQRAVELAKVSWTATGQDNAQMVLETGKRSE